MEIAPIGAHRKALNMTVHLYKDGIGQWRGRLKAANKKIVADAAEGYWNKADAEHGINLVKGAFSAPVYA